MADYDADDMRADHTKRHELAVDLCLALAFLIHALLFLEYRVDDAFILFRYAAMWASGEGPVFNPGELVEGYSSPLWVAILAGVHRIAGHALVPVFAQIMDLVAGGALVLVAARIARSACLLAKWGASAARAAGATAGGLLVVSPAFAMHGVNGLETAPYALSLASGALLLLRSEMRGRWAGAGVALAAAALLRPEGGTMALCLCICAGFVELAYRPKNLPDVYSEVPPPSSRWRRYLLLDIALVTAAMTLGALCRYVFYEGALFPNTFHAKSGGFWGISAKSYVSSGLFPPLLGVVGMGVGFFGIILSPTVAKRVAPSLIVGLIGGLLPLLLGSDWMPGARLVVPYLPLLSAVLAVGCVSCALLIARFFLGGVSPRALSYCVAGIVVGGAWFSQRAEGERLREYASVRARGYATGHTALAEWLGERTESGETVAMMDVGLVGYERMELRLLDLAGLTDARIARSPGGSLDKWYDPAYVVDAAPAYVVLVFTAPIRGDEHALSAEDLTPLLPHARRIYQDPGFRDQYMRMPPESVAPGPSGTDTLAAGLGAERVFVHAHPWRHYLLAVFGRR
ncbi:MAG: hypothetical protein CME06_01875 [Gemmatimonadetes bacterium]|nr:hypothetical protein [Gemmatimonadota bacterium]